MLALDYSSLPRHEIRLPSTLFDFSGAISIRYAAIVTVASQDACNGAANDIDRPSMFAAVEACIY